MLRTVAKSDSEAQNTVANAPATRSTGRGTSMALLAAGILLGMLGAALIALPALDKSHAWITANAARHGIEGLPIALTGVVLCALGLMAGARRVTSAAEPAKADPTLLLEQVASDLATMRGGMQDLRVEFVYLKDAVHTAQMREVEMVGDGTDGPEAAIFRLAASMDQLSGRLEQRMKTQDEQVREGLGALRVALHATEERLVGLQAWMEAMGRAEPLEPEHEAVLADEDERQIDIEPGFTPSEDDLHVSVEFEESETDLGLLDELDDFGTPRQEKTSPSMRPSMPRERRQVGAIEMDSGIELRGPLPSAPAGESTEEKLARLRELMSDPLVRQALEGTRRSTTN